MRSAEPLEPEVLAALEAIDATLHGEPVDPEHADLAELALILRDDRPVPDGAFLARLDKRVAHRFDAPRRGRLRAWAGNWQMSVAALTAVAALCVAIVVVATRTHGNHGASVNTGGLALKSAAGTGTSASSGASSSAGSAGSAAGGASSRAASPASHAPAPSPPASRGRQIAQTARIDLRAQAGRLDAVAQEVFNVVGAEHGHVLSSQVQSNASGPGQATFSLQVPSGRLQTALDRLSSLARARVISRDDASRDITAQIGGAASRLSDARALRRSLLRQLADADTTAAVDHVQDELHRNATGIARDETALARLDARVSESTIAVTVQAPPVVHQRRRAASGFTFSRALHDAGHILLVAAGVAVIMLAVLVPLALVVMVCAWAWSFVLRRRREGALQSS